MTTAQQMPIYVAAKTANRRDLKSYQVMKKDRDLVYSPHLTTMFDLQEAIEWAQKLNEYHLHMNTLLEKQGL